MNNIRSSYSFLSLSTINLLRRLKQTPAISQNSRCRSSTYKQRIPLDR